jgi:hypothetical protein
MSRRSLLALLAIPVFLLVAIPSALAKSSKAKTSSAPVVTSIRPLKLKIGEKLTIHGRNFITGRHKDTIVFMGAGKRVVWVKADTASKNTLTVKLPTKLAVLLADKSGKQQPTRLLIRVISKKSARAFTKRSRSPIVSPNTILTGGAVAEPCPGYSNLLGDSDGDFLSNGLELALGTNPCKADSDGDGVTDGYEYQSALDLNRTANSSAIPWPYPGKRPYPNPLDPNDANTDYDGDSLTLREEYTASFARVLGLDPHNKLQTFVPFTPTNSGCSPCLNDVMVVAYSDGDQTTNTMDGAGNVIHPEGNPLGAPTGPASPTDPSAQSGFDVDGNGTIGDSGDIWSTTTLGSRTVTGWMNFDGNSYLSDDEKDVDQDGLSNYEETHGPLMGPTWWSSEIQADGTYPLAYAGTNWLDPDSDGDTIPDGADDQDLDGYTNIEEVLRGYAMPRAAASGDPMPTVNPFNPCYPNDASPSCMTHPPFNPPFGPFNTSSTPTTWHTWPAP